MLRILIALIIFLPVMAHAEQRITPPEIDKSYQIPDLSAEAAILLNRFKQLDKHAKKLSSGDSLDGDVDAVLQNLFLPENAAQFSRTYSRELQLAKYPDRANFWLSLARHYTGEGNDKDAATAAYQAQKLEKNKKSRAMMLALLGEVYVELGKLEDGLNILGYSQRLSQNTNIQQRIRTIQERFFLIIRDISVNVEQASPNACIVFSKKLLSGQQPQDYISVTGLSDIDINARGNQICLNGLDYGKTYEVHIKKGLKGQEKTLLAQDSVRKFTIHDRESRASFEGNSYVISRTSNNRVPLTTVNVDKLKLALYLIHDRNLLHGTNNGLFNNLRNHNAETLKNDSGSLIWEGEITIENARNKEIRTLIPLTEMIKEKENGVYILTARQPRKEGEKIWQYNNRALATQWLLVSDMGLTSFRGKDGLHVMVRSLQSADPLRKVKLTLVARNNKILGTVTSDKNGMAHLPMGLVRGKGGDAPVLITATGKAQDYNFLKLENSYLDLSARGVAGRLAPGKQDAFLYTDRGVYRPGSRVRMSALLRNPESRAIGSLPLTFKVNKPDGSILLEKNITGDALGGYAFDIDISASAIPGRYRAISYLGKEILGHVSFQVEDFVPQRIRARLNSDEKWLEQNKKAEITLKANFLYGPPATGLKSETRISLKTNPRPYPKYSGYHFGLVEDDFYAKSLSPVTVETDEAGEAIIPLKLENLPDTTRPLLAFLQSAVFDVSGRPVNAAMALPLRNRDVEVGLKRDFSGSLSAGDAAAFEIIALSRDGKPVTGRAISYELVKEDYYYSWFRYGNNWNSRRNMTDSMVETGEVITDAKGLAKIAHFTKDGRYRLNILDKNGSSAASQRYYVGWRSAGSLPNVPDELELSLKDNSISNGKMLTAFIKAPFAGKATIMVMNDRIRLTRNITLPKEGREISLKVDKDWGPGAYLMVTAFRPEAGKVSKLPVRATQLQWFSIDKEIRSAKVEIEVPDTVIPRQTITLPVMVTGANVAGQKFRLTIAAVDEGILGLTGFKSPNPLGHFLSQRRLGMSIADLYGRLITPVDGVRGKLRTGGDLARMMSAPMTDEMVTVTAEKKKSDENTAGVQIKTVKTVALYSRTITLDEIGKGSVTLDLPDFNGRLRLMAVAYGTDIVGQGEKELIVRDPVVADLLLPRFLAPGDQAETTLSVHNLSGKKRTFAVTLTHADGLKLQGEKALTITLEDGKRFEQKIPLSADKVGASKVSLTVKTNGLPDISRHWDIAVRAAQPYVTRRTLSYLDRGDHEVISMEDINGFLPGTVTANLTLTDKPDYNIPDLLDSLYSYPYACGEQTTSRALPLLYYGDLAATFNKEYDPLKMRRVIDKAITHLLDMQRHDGSFALWRSTGKTHPWLSAYIFEFLSRAKEQNIEVPMAAYDHAREWLKARAGRRSGADPHVTAYAFYVLARTGDIQHSDIRYFADNHGQNIRTRIGLGHLAAALNLIGETALADKYFSKALKTRRPVGKHWVWYKDFGSDLRDGAMLATLIAEATSGDIRQLKLAEAVDREFDRRKYFSTQEQAWLMLATHAMSQNAKDGFQLSLNGKAQAISTTPLRYSLKPEAFKNGFNIENIGNAPIRAIQSLRAVPTKLLKPMANGFEISRSFYSLTGQKIDLNNIKQNDMLLVVIEGRSLNNIDHEGLIVDLLPAGFEIENASIGGFKAGKEKKFLPRKTPFLYEAARDDRYVAAFNLGSYRRKFATSYIVRAVTPGTYIMPAIFVEDMYKPQYHARGAVGKVTIGK